MTTAERLRVAADLLDEVGLRPEVRVEVSVGTGITVNIQPWPDTTPTERWRAFVEMTAALSWRDMPTFVERDDRVYGGGYYREVHVTVIAHATSPATAEVDA